MDIQVKITEYRAEMDFIDMVLIRGSRTDERTANRLVFLKVLQEYKQGRAVNIDEIDKDILEWVIEKGGADWVQTEIGKLTTL